MSVIVYNLHIIYIYVCVCVCMSMWKWNAVICRRTLIVNMLIITWNISNAKCEYINDVFILESTGTNVMNTFQLLVYCKLKYV